jgi:hypothetical protein
MSLSSLIVQREVATMRQVEEALARQVIYGGDLVTNLLEVARVDESTLGQLLAESMDLAAASSGPLPHAADALTALVPVEMALERTIVPIEGTAETLVLAVAEPLPDDVKEQLAFALGMRIEERAAPAVRVWEAIAAAYGAPLDRRIQRLIGRLAGEPGTGGTSLPPPLDTQRSSVATAAPSRARSVPPPRARPSPPPAAPITGAGSMRGTLGRRATLTSFPAHGAPPPAPLPEALGGDPAVTRPLLETRSSLLQRAVAPAALAARTVRRRRGPLTFKIARHDADEAVDRDSLLALFFDFSRQFFEYAAIFLVQADIAEGRDGFGCGATRERVLGIGVPLDLPSLLSRARDSRVPIMGSAPADGLDAALLADLQRPRDTEIVVLPLVVRTRAVALLVGDCGDSGLDRDALDQVTAFCGVVSKAFERIIVRRKLEGFVAGSRSGAAAPADGSMVAADAAKHSSAPPLAESPAGPGDVVPARPLSSAPPAVGIAAIRPISSPPIPREEPPWSPESAQASAADRPWAPHTERTDLPPDPLPTEMGAAPDSSFDEAWRESGRETDSLPLSAIAVPPRRPPSARTGANDGLPSVIVDVERELDVVVERLLAGEVDDQAEGELLRQGEHAMRVLMARFPGPLTFQRAVIATMSNPPRASECGPLLRLIARERKVALPFVLERISDRDVEVRGWATHLLGELPYLEALPSLLAGLQDVDATTRVSAALAIGAMAKGYGEQVLKVLGDLANSADPSERTAALRAAAEVREPTLVPDLVQALGDPDEAVIAAAREALVRTTRQDFGTDARRWNDWWGKNSGRDRLEWLIDALSHEAVDVRKAAGEELRLLSRQYFGYASDLPARDRERTQQRYRDWWITEGRSGRRWA